MPRSKESYAAAGRKGAAALTREQRSAAGQRGAASLHSPDGLIARLVKAAPELTAEQKAKLADLLRTPSGGASA